MHKHPGGVGCFINNLGYDVTDLSLQKHRWVDMEKLL